MNNIPSIQELNAAISNDLKSRLNISDEELRKTVSAFSAVMAAQFKIMYLRLADVQDNLFPDTADLAINGGELERLGQIYLNRNPNPATAGVFMVSVSGESGAVLREGLTFKSNDDTKNPGQLYILDTEIILSGNNDVIEVRSLGGGVEYDLDITNQLSITEPVIGVDQNVEVTGIEDQPRAAESIADYRQAILDAIQLEPQGGAKTDYMIWAKDAQGVRRVYPYVKNTNAGVVEVFVEATLQDSTDGIGTPSEALLEDVREVLEYDPDETRPQYERGRAPIQAVLDVKAVNLIPIDVDVYQLETDTVAIRDAIETNLKEYLRNVRPYIDGGDLARDKNDVLLAAKLQGVVTDVLGTSNYFTDFIMKVTGVPMTSSLFSGADIPYLNSVNYL